MGGAEDGEDGSGFTDDATQHAVSRSYEWLLAVINHLSSEYALLLLPACYFAVYQCFLLS